MEEYKGYRILVDGFSMYKVIGMGKGAVPKDLQGRFTSKAFARSAIDGYLAIKGE